MGNDTGGALCQIVVDAAAGADRAAGAHLLRLPRQLPAAGCSAYFKPAAAIPGGIKLLMLPMRLRAPRRLPIAFGWLVKRPIERQAEDSYLLAGMTIPGVEQDLRRVIKGLDARYTNEAADRLREFGKPALIAWSGEDRFFKPAHAQQLARDLPNARLEWIEHARSLSSEDEPGRLAELIAAFVREPASYG